MSFPNQKHIKGPEHTKSTVSTDQIAVEAYYLWEAAGRPEGRAVEHWLEAEARLRGGATPRALLNATEGARERETRRVRYGLVLRR